MKNRIIALIVGMSMILTCSPVLAKDNTIVKHVNDVKLEDKSTEVLFNSSNSDVFNANSKLGNPKVKLNENSLKKSKEKSKSSLNYVSAEDNQTTTGSAVTINDSPNNAYVIDINTICSDTMTIEGGQRWYIFNNPSAQKLTVIMQAQNSTNVDYNLFLFKFNEQTNNLDLVANSLYPDTANEQLSTIGQEGIYFMGINSEKGFDDTNPFKFAIIPSNSYGANEPDDNVFQAKSYNDSLSIEDTIDNNLDQDWSKLSITETSIISGSLTNASSSSAYKAEIINSQLDILQTVGTNSSKNFVLAAGTYYVRVTPNGNFDANEKYKLDLKTYGQSTLLGWSPDYKYVVTKDSNKNVYVNGKVITVDWKRDHNFSFPGGGYEYISQEVYKRSDSELIGAQYGTYTSNYTGTINNAFNLIINNPQYFYWYTRNYNQVIPTYHDEINEPIPAPVSLIINADTGKVVDFNSDNFNFYYINKFESHNFTQIGN